jgi:hypothetical protein
LCHSGRHTRLDVHVIVLLLLWRLVGGGEASHTPTHDLGSRLMHFPYTDADLRVRRWLQRPGRWRAPWRCVPSAWSSCCEHAVGPGAHRLQPLGVRPQSRARRTHCARRGPFRHRDAGAGCGRCCMLLQADPGRARAVASHCGSRSATHPQANPCQPRMVISRSRLALERPLPWAWRALPLARGMVSWAWAWCRRTAP